MYMSYTTCDGQSEQLMVVMMLYQQCESYCCAIYEFSNSYNLHYVETLLSVNCTSGKLTSRAFALIIFILMFWYSGCKEMTEVMAVTVCGDRVFPLATIACHGSMRHHIYMHMNRGKLVDTITLC